MLSKMWLAGDPVDHAGGADRLRAGLLQHGHGGDLHQAAQALPDLRQDLPLWGGGPGAAGLCRQVQPAHLLLAPLGLHLRQVEP